jgi:hypothetical protein
MRLLARLESPDFEAAAIVGFALDDLIESGAEGILAQDPDAKRPVRIRIRPVHKARELIEECGFKFIFAG